MDTFTTTEKNHSLAHLLFGCLRFFCRRVILLISLLCLETTAAADFFICLWTYSEWGGSWVLLDWSPEEHLKRAFRNC